VRHVISVLVENKFGVLARISGLFSARGFNIDSLAVGETEDPSVSRMTITLNAKDEKILEQIQKQLHKLIDVITVVDLTKKEYFERELVMVKVSLAKKNKAELEKIANKYNADIVHSDKEAAILEAHLDQEKMEKFLSLLGEFGVTFLARTGRIAVPK